MSSWMLTMHTDQITKTAVASFSAIVGFALGCKIFWEITDKIARGRN